MKSSKKYLLWKTAGAALMLAICNTSTSAQSSIAPGPAAKASDARVELNELQSRAIIVATKRLFEDFGDVKSYLVVVKADEKGAYVNFIALDPDRTLPMLHRFSGGGVTYKISKEGVVVERIFSR